MNLQCPRCLRVQDDAFLERYDPPGAVLLVTLCPDCSDETGAFHPSMDYYDAEGNWLNDKQVE